MRKLSNQELERLSPEEIKVLPKTPLVFVLDNVRSLLNIGSVFRSADAFRIEAIHLCGITACPPHREIQKTALGATESVDWKYFEHTKDSIDWLKQHKYKVLAIEQAEKSTSLENFIPEPELKYAFVFGHEVNGVQQEIVNIADGCIEIPQFGSKHSLNVAISAGILGWDFVSKKLKEDI